MDTAVASDGVVWRQWVSCSAPGSHMRTSAVVNAASATTTRNGQRRQTATPATANPAALASKHQC